MNPPPSTDHHTPTAEMTMSDDEASQKLGTLIQPVEPAQATDTDTTSATLLEAKQETVVTSASGEPDGSVPTFIESESASAPENAAGTWVFAKESGAPSSQGFTAGSIPQASAASGSVPQIDSQASAQPLPLSGPDEGTLVEPPSRLKTMSSERQESSTKRATWAHASTNMVRKNSTVSSRHRDPSDRNPPVLNEDHFQLQDFLARGGMGEVWMAVDPSIGRTVVLKTLRAGLKAAEARFMLEASITGRLEHPGVVPVYELGIDEAEQPFYAMKFIQGRTLKTAIQDFLAIPSTDFSVRELQLQSLLLSFISMCDTISFAHHRGIIHRDIKPENVMLGQFGETLVLDWGLARDRSAANNPTVDHSGLSGSPGLSAGSATRAGSMMGSPFYMAPEMLAGRSDQADERTDIYLLGATLYEILTGVAPHQDRDIRRSRTFEAAVPPRQRNPGLPKALDAICLKALAERSEDRYGTALELAEDMRRYVAGEPVSVCPETYWERTRRWLRRHQVLVRRAAIGGLLAASMLVGLALVRENRQLLIVDQARRDEVRFRRLSDEAHYFAASSDRLDERTPFYDPALAERSAIEAFRIMEAWGSQLEQFPLSESVRSLRDELQSLILITVQLRLKRDPTPEIIAGCRTSLDWAERLTGPTEGLQSLRAQCDAIATEDSSITTLSETLPRTSLDHFLAGERLRTNAVRLGVDDETGWAIHRQQLEAAIAEYRAATRQQSGHFWSHFQLGRCYLSLGRKAEAVEALGTCVALKPNSPWAWSSRGLALALLGRFDESLADLEQAIQQDQNFQPARLHRGVTLWLASQATPDKTVSTEQLKQALSDFQQILDSPTPLIEAAYYRALIHSAQGHRDEVLDDLTRVLNERSDFVPARQLRSRLHLASGHTEEGFADIDALTQAAARRNNLVPVDWQFRLERGRLIRRLLAAPPTGPPLARRELLALARQELEAAVKLVGDSVPMANHVAAADLFAEFGSILELEGQAESAFTAYSRAIEFAPRQSRLWVKRGWLLALRLERLAAARADFQQALKLTPEDAEASSASGFLQALTAQSSDASRSALKAVLWGAGDSLILHNVACVYAELAARHPATASLNESLALDVLERGLQLWQRGGRPAPNVLELARQESSFRNLRMRAEFQQLLLLHEQTPPPTETNRSN